MDRLSKEHRSWNMSRIRGKDTKPELIVRSVLHRMGYRFRVHVKGLPGTPDIVLPKYRTVIFVHGCFWHRHTACKNAYEPKGRSHFWSEKLKANVRRDERNEKALRKLGWYVTVIWECQLTSPRQIARRLRAIRKTSPG